jgi:hypothetical protein
VEPDFVRAFLSDFRPGSTGEISPFSPYAPNFFGENCFHSLAFRDIYEPTLAIALKTKIKEKSMTWKWSENPMPLSEKKKARILDSLFRVTWTSYAIVTSHVYSTL